MAGGAPCVSSYTEPRRRPPPQTLHADATANPKHAGRLHPRFSVDSQLIHLRRPPRGESLSRLDILHLAVDPLPWRAFHRKLSVRRRPLASDRLCATPRLT